MMMQTNLININPYPKPKKDGGGGSSNITFNINTSDIGGDLNVKSLNANRVVAEYVEANNLEAANGNFVYLVASDGTISTLRGDDLTYDTANIGDLTANNIETQKLNVTDTATIENIFNTYLNSKEIVTDYLTVNKSAHFFEVIIDKIKSVGGTIINTATSCVLDYVIPYNASGPTTFDEDPTNITKYRCYWKRYANENSQDKKDEVQNEWWVKDQAISQNCHLQQGVSHNAGNHYYWRLVDDVSGDNPVYVNFDTGQVWNEQGIPEYKIKFSGHQADNELQDDVEIAAGFTYDNGENDTEDRPDAQLIITDWNIAPVSGITADWDETNKEFTVRDTINGLQIMPIPNGSDGIEQAPYISKGTFSFATEYPTRLNLFIFYDDETVEYHPAPDVKQSIYQINLASITGAIATRFVITSAEVNIWHLCNWIDLSNTDMDTPTHITGNFDDAPRAGDNVCQLGYRYTAYNEGDEEYVPSRASAIIIASFATPDSGGTINGNVIKPIVPPSYAQYQNITDYNLYTHRGTYMDAEEAHFKGAIEAGSSIDGDVINVTTKMWKLIPDKNPIVKGDTVQFTIFYSENGEGQAISSLDTGWYLMVYTQTSQGWQTGVRFNSLSVTTTSSTLALKVELWDGSGTGNILRDVFEATVIDLDSVTDGIDGAYDQWAYKNSATGPQAPISNSTYPPTGWQAQPTTPSEGGHTWMTTRTVTPTTTNPHYGNWSTPIRITGDDGRPGEDGTDFEFIYFRTNDPTSVTNPNNIPQGEVSPTGVANGSETDKNLDDWVPNGWTDRPQGVDSEDQYEYMSQRKSYDSNGTKMWNNFTTPALWSKWGENGLDGDGIKYIFTKAASALNAPYFGTNGWNESWTEHLDNNNGTTQNRHKWYDNGFGPTDTVVIDYEENTLTNSDVLCSISKTYEDINGTRWWKDWSTPKVWAMYVRDGQNGTNGTNGTNGNDGDTDILAPVSERFIVTISLHNYNNAIEVWTSDYYNQVKSALECDLQYKINKKVGNDYAVMTANDISNARYTLKFRLNMTSGANYTDDFTLVDNTFKLFPSNATYRNNLLEWLWTKQSSNKTNKNYEQDAMEGKDTPVSCDVLLYKNNVEVMVAKHYDVIFDTGDIFRHDKYSFNSILFGTYTYTENGETKTINSMSSIHQTMNEISTRVQGITYNSTTGETIIDNTTIQQLSNSITATVSQQVLNTVDGRGYQTAADVQLTAESISAAVQTDIEGKLKRTGIDISNGLVNIASDNTTIGGNVYIHGGVLKSNGLISSVYLPVSCTCSRKENTTATYTLTTNKSVIDTLLSGDKITIDNLNKELLQTDLRGQTTSQPSLLGTVTYKIYKDSTLVTSFTSKPSSAITISTGGTYYLEVTANATLTGAYSYTFNAGLDITLSKATAVEIADNGINLSLAGSNSIQNSNKHYMRFSPDTIESAIFEVGTYATNNGSQHFPLGGLRIANGMPQMRITQQTYGNTSQLPTYSRVNSAGLWGSLGSQLAVKMCSTTSEHPLPQVDFYIYTETRPNNAVFDLTVTGKEAMYGLYTGRIIRIKGYNGLVINCPTKIIRKENYYGWDQNSYQIKMGGNSNSNFNSSNGKVIDYYSLTLILVGTIWYEI